MATHNALNRLVISSPCHADWHEMQDSGGGRHYCSACRKPVYDLASMTPLQIEARRVAGRGRLCVRITRNPDGEVITRAPLPQMPIPSDFGAHRVSPLVAAVVAALLGLGRPLDSAAADRSAVQSYGATAEIQGALASEDLLALTVNPESLDGEPETVLATIVVGGATAPSLEDTFAESPLVVLATAGRSVVLKEENGFETVSTRLRLDAGSVLKGKIPRWAERSFRMIYEPSPFEEKIVPGSRVLAFLELPRSGGRKPARTFEPAAVHGLRRLSTAEETAYRERIAALVALQAGPELRPEAKTEWLVATAEEPETRKDVNLSSVADELSPEQQERLSRALAGTSGLTSGDLRLGRVVAIWDRPAFVSWLTHQILTADSVEDAAGAEAMGLLADELADPALQALVQEASDAELEAQNRYLSDDSLTREQLELFQLSYGDIQKDLRRRFRAALGERLQNPERLKPVEQPL